MDLKIESCEVDQIIDQRQGAAGSMEYLIRWAGYSSDYDSWTKDSDLHCPEILKEFKSTKNTIPDFEIAAAGSESKREEKKVEKKEEEGNLLELPNGEKISDAMIIKDAMKKWKLGCPDKLFKSFDCVPQQDSNLPIAVSKDGTDPLLVKGDHPALHYRGNALKRHKVWLQRDFSGGFLKYGYTGWQHAIAAATRDVRSVPAVESIMDTLNKTFPSILRRHGLPASKKAFNHAIFTRYEDHNDFIGLHSDKEKDFEEDSYFVVLKLGAPRNFVFSDSSSSEPAEKAIFWQQELTAGTAILVRTKTSDATPSANSRVKHGVPVMKEPCARSGSIVFRAIKTCVPWSQVAKDMDRAKRAKRKRAQSKAERKVKASAGRPAK